MANSIWAASGGANLVQYRWSPDASTTWTLGTDTGSPGTSNDIAYAAGIFAGVTNNGAASSVDGKFWTKRTLGAGTGEIWGGICYGGGQFVAVGYGPSNAARAATSPDGITWTTQSDIAGTWRDIAYGQGKFVAVGDAGLCRVSPDGASWSSATIGTGNWASVCFDTAAVRRGRRGLGLIRG